MYDVVCLSDCCADGVFQGLPCIPGAGEEVYCRGFSLHAGGGANTPIGLARLGCRTAYAATVGQDPLGRIVLDEMLQAGIDPAFIRQGKHTWVSAVLSMAEDRAFASYAGDSAEYSEEDLRQIVSSARWLHTYAYYAEKYAALPGICKELGVPLSMDLTYDPSRTLEDLAPMLSMATLVTPNASEACGITSERDVEHALHRLAELCPNIVITMGSQGCIAVLDGGMYRAYAPQIDMVDANGAGDLFNAGLLAARMKGLNARQQLQMACAAGSIAVTCVGSMDERFALPAIEQLAARIRVEAL